MPNSVSWTLRNAANAAQTPEAPIVLVKITHPSLSEPVYLSADPTERLSVDPLAYGTVHQGTQYLFVLMNAVLPDDQKDAPPKSTLIFENVAPDMAKAIRSINTPCTVDITVVLASSPDSIEVQYTGMQGVKGTYDANQVSLDISREPFTSEPCPAGRFTPGRFPGLSAN